MCERSDARNSPLRVKLRKIFFFSQQASQYEHITHVMKRMSASSVFVSFFLSSYSTYIYSKLSFQETVLLAIIIVDIIAVAKQYFRYNNASKKFFNYVAIGFHPACSCTA